MFGLAAVIAENVSKFGTILDSSFPVFLFINLEDRQINDFPPLDKYAPKTKSSCPPAPDICFAPEDSELTCPNKSTFTALFIETKLSICEITLESFV